MCVVVGAVLDGSTGARITAEIAANATPGAEVCIDVSAVEEFTAAGLSRLGECRRVATHAGATLSYRAASRPGWRALLTVLSDSSTPPPTP